MQNAVRDTMIIEIRKRLDCASPLALCKKTKVRRISVNVLCQ